jgi:phosphate transport system permease protein
MIPMSEVNATKRSSTNHHYQQWRLIKDQIAEYGVVAGGLGVIAAIVLIFFYLLYVVFPLFIAAEADSVNQYELPEKLLGQTVYLAMEEQNEIAVRFTNTGKAVFFGVAKGKVIAIKNIQIPDQVEIVSFAHGSVDKGTVVYGLSDGRAVVVRHQYKVSYLDDVRLITPELEYPLGEEPIVLDSEGYALIQLTIKINEEQSTLIAKTSDKRVLLSSFVKEESMFDDEGTLKRTDAILDVTATDIDFMLLDKEQQNLYLASEDGDLSVVDVRDKEHPEFKHKLELLAQGDRITAIEFLTGDLSLLIGDTSGVVSQWSIVRDEKGRSSLQKIRAFKVSDQAIGSIVPEQRRKGLMVADVSGYVGIYHSTAERELIRKRVSEARPVALAFSPRANAFLLQSESGTLDYWTVENEHPEVSMASIWQEIWYESYPKPDYIWQSSSASNDFEPKMSLTPLVFGTLKAAFYAMLMAVPLSLMGAIYTAYFMAPRMRQLVKPSIEIMEALPTVILGFLAGLWLAPFVEDNLVGIFALLMVVPLCVITFAYLWQFLPKTIRHKVPEGWDAALLIPVILMSTWLAFFLSPGIEMLFFNGDVQVWMQKEFGIGYDQRNSVVVGLAMGFAVIPTIFSIAEDAIFSVPKHLTTGSLALGATPWQTMTRVVLLTASPGIFSAVMIGFGRAVGETMIVLMATGNTPIMDLSVFQGMRTLAANIAVEMPESEVDSTHYRVLFLAALVLFMFTFVFNTLAELIRQNLRQKYSSL